MRWRWSSVRDSADVRPEEHLDSADAFPSNARKPRKVDDDGLRNRRSDRRVDKWSVAIPISRTTTGGLTGTISENSVTLIQSVVEVGDQPDRDPGRPAARSQHPGQDGGVSTIHTPQAARRTSTPTSPICKARPAGAESGSRTGGRPAGRQLARL